MVWSQYNCSGKCCCRWRPALYTMLYTTIKFPDFFKLTLLLSLVQSWCLLWPVKRKRAFLGRHSVLFLWQENICSFLSDINCCGDVLLLYLSKTFSNEKENNIKRKPQIILRLTIALLKSPQDIYDDKILGCTIAQTDLIFCLRERKKSWSRVSQSNL